MIIWWSSIDYMTNKQTNLIIWWSFYDRLLYDNNKAYHLLIIWWSSVIWHQTNKQTNKQINVIRWGSSNDHLTIICYKLTKNRQTNFIIWWLSDDNFMIIWWSFDDHLIIVWWYSLVNEQTNKQRNKHRLLNIINYWFDIWISPDYLMIWWSVSFSSVDNLMMIWWSSVD